MKRIHKSLSACIISILLLVFLSFPAFAEVSAETQDAVNSYIQQIMPELTSLTAEDADETIAYYNESGYPGIASGFESWIELSETAGEYQSVGPCTVTEVGDGSMILTAEVTCTNDVLTVEVYLDSSGYVSSFLFKKGGSVSSEGSLGAKMKEATVNLIVGMGTVFAVLIFLCWVISLFKNIGKIEKKIADRKAAKTQKDTVATIDTVNNASETISVSPAPLSDNELQAVIAAAIAAYEADNGTTIEKQPSLGNGITIKTYRRN